MSADMISGLINSVGGPAVDALAAKVGVPAELVNKFKPILIGLVVAGIARMLKQPGGDDQMQNLINSSSQEVGAQSAADFINNIDPSTSMNLLNTLTGGNSMDNVVNNLAGATGMDAGQLTGVLGSVAPLVLSSLGQAQKAGGLNTQQFAASLSESAAAMPELKAIDYALDNTPGIGDDIKRGFNALFGKK